MLIYCFFGITPAVCGLQHAGWLTDESLQDRLITKKNHCKRKGHRAVHSSPRMKPWNHNWLRVQARDLIPLGSDLGAGGFYVLREAQGQGCPSPRGASGKQQSELNKSIRLMCSPQVAPPLCGPVPRSKCSAPDNLGYEANQKSGKKTPRAGTVLRFSGEEEGDEHSSILEKCTESKWFLWSDMHGDSTHFFLSAFTRVDCVGSKNQTSRGGFILGWEND